MHAENLVFNERSNRQTVEDISERSPELDAVAAFALIIKAINAVDRTRLVVPSEQKKVFRVLDLKAQEKANCLDALVRTINLRCERPWSAHPFALLRHLTGPTDLRPRAVPCALGQPITVGLGREPETVSTFHESFAARMGSGVRFSGGACEAQRQHAPPGALPSLALGAVQEFNHPCATGSRAAKSFKLSQPVERRGAARQQWGGQSENHSAQRARVKVASAALT